MENLTIRSSVTQECQSSCLRRACLFAVTGAILLLAAAIFPWKLPLFLASLLLIGTGLRPYRLLQKLECNPHTLVFDGKHYIFTKMGKPLFRVPLEHISRMEHFQDELTYGIAIDLCGQVEPLQKIDLAAFVSDSRSRAQCDLFLPFFTKKSFELLK